MRGRFAWLGLGLLLMVGLAAPAVASPVGLVFHTQGPWLSDGWPSSSLLGTGMGPIAVASDRHVFLFHWSDPVPYAAVALARAPCAVAVSATAVAVQDPYGVRLYRIEADGLQLLWEAVWEHTSCEGLWLTRGGGRLYVNLADRVEARDGMDGEVVWSLGGTATAMRALDHDAFPDELLVAPVGRENMVESFALVVEGETGIPVWTLAGTTGRSSGTLWHGRALVAGDGLLRLYVYPHPLPVWVGASAAVTPLNAAFLPDGSFAVTEDAAAAVTRVYQKTLVTYEPRALALPGRLALVHWGPGELALVTVEPTGEGPGATLRVADAATGETWLERTLESFDAKRFHVRDDAGSFLLNTGMGRLERYQVGVRDAPPLEVRIVPGQGCREGKGDPGQVQVLCTGPEADVRVWTDPIGVDIDRLEYRPVMMCPVLPPRGPSHAMDTWTRAGSRYLIQIDEIPQEHRLESGFTGSYSEDGTTWVRDHKPGDLSLRLRLIDRDGRVGWTCVQIGPASDDARPVPAAPVLLLGLVAAVAGLGLRRRH